MVQEEPNPNPQPTPALDTSFPLVSVPVDAVPPTIPVPPVTFTVEVVPSKERGQACDIWI